MVLFIKNCAYIVVYETRINMKQNYLLSSRIWSGIGLPLDLKTWWLFKVNCPWLKLDWKIPLKTRSFLLFQSMLWESHIQNSTCFSSFRASPKGGEFLDISDWLSCLSNKLFNGGHVEKLRIFLRLLDMQLM
jgi:hypothetical protein